MKQSQALVYLSHFEIFVQRLRSIFAENGNSSILDDAYPANNYLNKNSKFFILPIIEKHINLAENGKLTPQQFYNMMFIADSFIPEISIQLDYDLPKPDIKWLKDGWQDE